MEEDRIRHKLNKIERHLPLNKKYGLQFLSRSFTAGSRWEKAIEVSQVFTVLLRETDSLGEAVCIVQQLLRVVACDSDDETLRRAIAELGEHIEHVDEERSSVFRERNNIAYYEVLLVFSFKVMKHKEVLGFLLAMMKEEIDRCTEDMSLLDLFGYMLEECILYPSQPESLITKLKDPLEKGSFVQDSAILYQCTEVISSNMEGKPKSS